MDEERRRSDPIYAAAYERQSEEIKRQTAEKTRDHARRLESIARANAQKALEQARRSKYNDFKSGPQARSSANERARPGASDQSRRRTTESDPLDGWSTRKHRFKDESDAIPHREVKQEPGTVGSSDNCSLFVQDWPRNTTTNTAHRTSTATDIPTGPRSSPNITHNRRPSASGNSARPRQPLSDPAARDEHQGQGRRSYASTSENRAKRPSEFRPSEDRQVSASPVHNNDQSRRSSANAATGQTKRPLDPCPTEEPQAPALKVRKRSSRTVPSIAGPAETNLQGVGAGTSTSASTDKRPEWYRKLDKEKKRVRNPVSTNADGALQRLKTSIRDINSQKVKGNFSGIREILHTLAFIEVSRQLLRNNYMLHDDGVLSLVEMAPGGVALPFDIRADAEELYNKWYTGEMEVDIYRGITRGLPGKKTSTASSAADRLAPGHEKFKLMDPKQHGNGRLLNGQWWPSQLAALRDGARGSSQGGITGSVGAGAYSVIMAGGVDPSGQPYPNEDRGDEVLYCGTDNKASTNEPSAETQFMLENVRSKQPVRLIRSHNLHSPYTPELGFRYDGLYTVVDYEEMDPPDVKRRRHRFRLVRCAGQDPIRGQGPEKRPTVQEREAYEKDRKNRGR